MAGRLTVLCSACNDFWKERKAATADAHVRGYADYGHTPEYKRGQYERIAADEGRRLAPYVPLEQRCHAASMSKAEWAADQLRARWAAAWLHPFRGEKHLYESDVQYRETVKAKFRAKYARRIEHERVRSTRYKVRHWDRKLDQDARRIARMADQADGTALSRAITRLKAGANSCAYCEGSLSEKQTDHMIPLGLGGEHSLRNIVIVCPSCNGHKARLNYSEWIERVAPEHRQRVIDLWCQRYGPQPIAA